MRFRATELLRHAFDPNPLPLIIIGIIIGLLLKQTQEKDASIQVDQEPVSTVGSRDNPSDLEVTKSPKNDEGDIK